MKIAASMFSRNNMFKTEFDCKHCKTKQTPVVKDFQI